MPDAITNAHDQDQVNEEAATSTPPDWVQDPARAYQEIRRLRDENAATRSRLRELEAQHQQQADVYQQTETELESLRTEIEIRERDALRQQIAEAVGLPPTLAARLQGDDAESLRADAAALRESLASESTLPRGQAATVVPGGPPVSKTRQQLRQLLYGEGGYTQYDSSGAVESDEARWVFGT